jgi:hypothetical protein
VCHQFVCGLLPSSTSAASQFWPLCVSSGSMWSPSFKHKCCLIILASLCAIRKYVVSFLQAQVLPHHFGLFVCHQKVGPFIFPTLSDCFGTNFFHLFFSQLASSVSCSSFYFMGNPHSAIMISIIPH